MHINAALTASVKMLYYHLNNVDNQGKVKLDYQINTLQNQSFCNFTKMQN